MARASVPKREFLPRTVKWEIEVRKRPDLEALLIRISDGLREYEHWALEKERAAYESYKALKEASPNIKPNAKSFLTDFDLYSAYMPLREADERSRMVRARIPANWVLESCFRKVSAAYKSWFELLKTGDPDARAIQPSGESKFVAIQGALNPGSVKHRESGSYLVLAPKIFPGQLEFEIPRAHQAPLLANAKRFAKFVISRRKPDLRYPGRFWLSVTYEIEKPETVPFVPQQAVYLALGASSIGIVSPRGEEVIPLWRSDRHWKPKIDAIDQYCSRKPTQGDPFPLKKGSRKWRRLQSKRNRMFEIMARQQTQDRREVVARDLIKRLVHGRACGHGLHFVLTEYDIRSKRGKLADAAKSERGGPLGLNWMAQNTGSIGYLARWLETKILEYGGAVHWHRLPRAALPEVLPRGHENKILVARALRDDFLRAYREGRAT